MVSRTEYQKLTDDKQIETPAYIGQLTGKTNVLTYLVDGSIYLFFPGVIDNTPTRQITGVVQSRVSSLTAATWGGGLAMRIHYNDFVNKLGGDASRTLPRAALDGAKAGA